MHDPCLLLTALLPINPHLPVMLSVSLVILVFFGGACAKDANARKEGGVLCTMVGTHCNYNTWSSSSLSV